MLKRLCPRIADAQRLVTAFQTILLEHTPDHLLPWLKRCAQSGDRQLVGSSRASNATSQLPELR